MSTDKTDKGITAGLIVAGLSAIGYGLWNGSKGDEPEEPLNQEDEIRINSEPDQDKEDEPDLELEVDTELYWDAD